MSKNKSASGLINVINYDNFGNISFVSGSTTLMQVSSSGAITTTGVISGSSAQSASLAQNSNLLQGTGSVGFATTASFTTASGSISTRVTQIEQVYATTGSNSFRATQSITGSLTVTGQIIAQTINVQQVTSSIIYSSGSNFFGCDINSRQVFTGSVFITGSTLGLYSNVACFYGTSYISASGDAFFNGRVCSSGLSTCDAIYLNSGSPLRFSGTCGYIYMFSRNAGGNCGAILINNGTGQNLWFGEVGSNTYSFGVNPAGTDYSGTPTLNMDILNGRVGIGCKTPDTPLYVVGEITSQNGEMYFKRSAFCDYGHIYMGSDKNFYIRQTAACSMVLSVGGAEKMRINSGNSIVGYSQWYTTYAKAVCTTDGGSQSVRFIEDSLGQWIQVGRFVANAAIAVQSTWSSVRGLSTSLAQDAATEFSADWGGSCPSEIRIMGATDFCRWRETRTVDFIYKNIPGRPWCTFFNGGTTNGTYQTTGTIRYGFNTCGTYDGFGRWTNPFNCMIGMSDGAYCNPSSAYTTPTANAFNWNTAQDAKLTAIHYTEYSGQDVNETTGFGVDDAVRGFFDSYPSLTSNMATGDVFTSAVWILLKFS